MVTGDGAVVLGFGLMMGVFLLAMLLVAIVIGSASR
jgi:hypothetical protein